jgi:hypothetical protein
MSALESSLHPMSAVTPDHYDWWAHQSSPVGKDLMKLGKFLFSIAITLGMAASLLAAPHQDSAKQDMKNAGSETKQAAKDTGNATKKTAKKTGHTVKKDTKSATNKAAKKTDEGAQKIEQKTQQ